MALPRSGQLAASAINTELGRGSTSQISIDAAENGSYGAINPFSRDRPNSANPAAYSEWYGYDHGAGGGPEFFPLPEIGYDRVNRDQACRNASLGRHIVVFGDGPSLVDCINLYNDANGSRFAASGYYAENFGQIYRFWNGTSFTQEGFCTI